MTEAQEPRPQDNGAFGKQPRLHHRNREIIRLYLQHAPTQEIAIQHRMTADAVLAVIRLWRRHGAPAPVYADDEKLLMLIENLIPYLRKLTDELAEVGGVLKQQQLRNQLGVTP